MWKYIIKYNISKNHFTTSTSIRWKYIRMILIYKEIYCLGGRIMPLAAL